MKKTKFKHRYQTKLNKLIKEANDAIIKDEIWLGRVEIRQIRRRWEIFEDGSGGILHTVIRCVDKKTQQYKDYTFEYAPWLSTIYWHLSMDILNKFFVEDIDVWRTGNPRNEIYDWTKIKVPDKVFTQRTSDKWLIYSLYQVMSYKEILDESN